ncbi:MAG: hypothetical protein B6D63_07160 [Candidatus Latescibacteria bacterium 4484_7]|nr:MAG: hypothetical protein B6D63_07160 [Candidatus Latescibacteria bacterium 4484_7]
MDEEEIACCRRRLSQRKALNEGMKDFSGMEIACCRRRLSQRKALNEGMKDFSDVKSRKLY